MRRKWLWLEDQVATVPDFRRSFDQYLEYESFDRINDFQRRLLELRTESADKLKGIGIILDVMIMAAPRIRLGDEWSGHTTPPADSTSGGKHAGLVLYELLFCTKNDKGEYPVVPLPPVAFLSVIKLQASELVPRVESIRETWSRVNRCQYENAKVTWFWKNEPTKDRIRETLLRWEAEQ